MNVRISEHDREAARAALTVAAAVIGGLVASATFGRPSASTAALVSVVVGLVVALLPVVADRRHPTEMIRKGESDEQQQPPDWWTTDAQPDARFEPEPDVSDTPGVERHQRRPLVDLAPYRRRVAPGRVPQCPGCGHFSVNGVFVDGGGKFACADCGHSFAWTTGEVWPPVAIDARVGEKRASRNRSGKK